MRKKLFLAGFVCFFYFSQAFALVGVSFQWGFDYTLKMDDIDFEPIFFDTPVEPDTLLTSIEFLETKLPAELGPDGPTKIQAFKDSINERIDVLRENSPISFKRYEWTKSVLNIGGKIFIDDIPIIDAVDISFNIGGWEYKSELRYPTGEFKKDIIKIEDVIDFLNDGRYEDFLEMKILPLTLEQFGYDKFKLFNLTQTPFIKMQFDLTIRKNIIAKPDELKLFQLYLGLGPSLHFSTPILTPELVIETIEQQFSSLGSDIGDLHRRLSDPIVMKKIIDNLLEEAKNPTFGMNILAGTMFKFPVVPLGIYIDLKYMIPFMEFDKKVKLGGFGFLLNTGICLTI